MIVKLKKIAVASHVALSSVAEKFRLNFVPPAAVTLVLRRQFIMFGYMSWFYFSIFEFILIVVRCNFYFYRALICISAVLFARFYLCHFCVSLIT